MRQTGQPGLLSPYSPVATFKSGVGVSPEGGPAAPCLFLPSQHWSSVTLRHLACLSPGKEGALGRKRQDLLQGSHGVWCGGLTWPERRRRPQKGGG